ncbi:MAG: type II toxin-antitoxin system RelE/ParE family toxin [Azospirillaceae bacterium]|nr:type II toxin-antitoxin system RelE/ParE family toxin [Azospirillaceae bacterium]
MRVILTPQARAEYVEAVDWYANQAPELARRLRNEFRTVRERIIANPRQFPIALRDTRSVMLRNFPYLIVFRVSGDVVQVISFFHTSRDPHHWQRHM